MFLFFKFLFLLNFTWQYCIGFAIHWHESTTGVHVFPNMKPPSHLLPHNISLGHPRAPAPSILYPALDINWRFISYMIVYMFQCHPPRSSHPLPLPQSPKVCSTHLSLFCCLAYRVIIAIFLNSEWIRKLWYIYTMEYYSAVKKNTFESVLMRWMKLEPIIQNEVSQKEKHQYSILAHIYGI